MTTILRLILLICICLLTACDKQSTKDSQLALIKTTNPSALVTNKNNSHDGVKKIEHDVNSFPELYDVAVIKGKKDILVVYKVKHLHRFGMKKIEKKVNKMLEKKYPKENFTVSSDYKIFLEAVRLEEKMKSPNFSHRSAEKRFMEIVNMTDNKK